MGSQSSTSFAKWSLGWVLFLDLIGNNVILKNKCDNKDKKMFDKEGYQRDLWQGYVRMKCGMTCHQEIRTTIVERNLGANKDAICDRK